jgi:hypothetical protein
MMHFTAWHRNLHIYERQAANPTYNPPLANAYLHYCSLF